VKKGPDKIIFVAPARSSFIRSDINILKTEFIVSENIYPWRRKALLPLYLLQQFLFFIRHIWWAKSVVIEFAGYWSLIPTALSSVLGVKSYIILHGTESASIPKLNYGSLRKPLLRWFCKKSFSYAYMLLPVSESLIKTKNSFAIDNKSECQGVKHHFPKIKTPFKVISNGLDVDFWSADINVEKEEKSFAAVFGKGQFILKGGDLLIELARRNPSIKIYVAGYTYGNEAGEIPDNISFMGILDRNQLKDLYAKCAHYFQLSVFEGFGLSLCEAMLCRCIPIGSNSNAIPEIIGDTGYIIRHRKITQLEKTVNLAMENSNIETDGEAARQRIIENYHISKRKSELIKTIKQA
jgi:glycosyltransferase involved in cell wall biosynthesis